MYDKLKKAVYDVISEGLDSDFWAEDSIIIDAHAEVTGEGVDCEEFSVYPHENEGLVVEIGDFKFLVKVENNKE